MNTKAIEAKVADASETNQASIRKAVDDHPTFRVKYHAAGRRWLARGVGYIKVARTQAEAYAHAYTTLCLQEGKVAG